MARSTEARELAAKALWAVVGSCLVVVVLAIGLVFALAWALPDGTPYGSDGPHSGWIAVWLGDADGDGVSDVALKTRFEPAPHSWQEWGTVRVLSGATGATLKKFDGAGTNAQLHEELGTAGDLDGDGKDEIWWSFDSHQLCVGSADQERPLFRLRVDLCAECLALEQDVDGDGFQDLFVTRFPALHGDREAVSLVSGRTGESIWTMDGPGMSDPHYCAFGDQPCRIADLDADGIQDLAVLDDTERVQLVSGRKGIHLRELPVSVESISGEIEDAGDLDGDGVAELLIYTGWGGYEDWQGMQPPRNPIQVVSARDGAVLRSLPAEPFLSDVFSPGDINGDGRLDLVWNSDGLSVASGADDRILHKLDGYASRGRADWNSDGCADLLVMHNISFEVGEQATDDLWRKGRLEIVSGRDGTVLKTFDESVLPPLQ